MDPNTNSDDSHTPRPDEFAFGRGRIGIFGFRSDRDDIKIGVHMPNKALISVVLDGSQSRKFETLMPRRYMSAGSEVSASGKGSSPRSSSSSSSSSLLSGFGSMILLLLGVPKLLSRPPEGCFLLNLTSSSHNFFRITLSCNPMTVERLNCPEVWTLSCVWLPTPAAMSLNGRNTGTPAMADAIG